MRLRINVWNRSCDIPARLRLVWDLLRGNAAPHVFRALEGITFDMYRGQSLGIIGENAIFTYRQFKESVRDSNVDDSIIYSISTKLRPKLMTALGAIIALLPLALGIGSGAELHQPLAIAVIGGFIMAIPLLLIVLPSGIRLINSRKRKEIG